MSTFFAERYSDLLSTDDILSLFRKLEEKQGSIVKAARICGIARKTVYHWNETGFITPRIKRKVVAALVEAAPEETLSFMVWRSSERATEVLATCMSGIYEKIMTEQVRDRTDELLAFFDQIRMQYSGLIVDKLHREVNEMASSLARKTAMEGGSWSPSPFRIFKVEQLDSVIPLVVEGIRVKRWSDEEVARRYNLPQKLVTNLSEALSTPIPESHQRFFVTNLWKLRTSLKPIEPGGQVAGWVDWESPTRLEQSTHAPLFGQITRFAVIGQDPTQTPRAQDSSTTPEPISELSLRSEALPLGPPTQPTAGALPG